MADNLIDDLLKVNQRLLDAITTADWKVYQELCEPTLTAFEPEALGQIVHGMDFHRFYFDLGGVKGAHLTTMCQPHVRIMGDVAVVSYVRLNQRLNNDRQPTTASIEETRVRQKKDGKWLHVHFHRSPIAKG